MAKRKKKVDEKAEAVVTEPIVWCVPACKFLSGYERAKDLMKCGAKVKCQPIRLEFFDEVVLVQISESFDAAHSSPTNTEVVNEFTNIERACGPLLTQLFAWAEVIEDDE